MDNDSLLDQLEYVEASQTFPQPAESQANRKNSHEKTQTYYSQQQTSDIRDSYTSKPSRLLNTFDADKPNNSMKTRQSLRSQSEVIGQSTDDFRNSTVNNKNSRILNKSDQFSCKSCFSGQEEQCEICNGKKQLTGQDKIIKFFEYILDFKLGNKLSYRPVKKLNKKAASINQHCNLYFSTLNQRSIQSTLEPTKSEMISSTDPRIVSKEQHEQKVKNFKEIHHGYNCDQCDAQPIVGPRYHCNQCENFDLCQQCYQRKGHYHEMNPVELKNGIKTLERVSNLLKSPNISGIRNSIRNTRNSMKSSLGMTSKIYRSSIR